MQTLLTSLMRGVPLSPETTRALDATFADWRHERGHASLSFVARAVAAAGLLVAVLRVLVLRSLREWPASLASPFLWRTLLSTGLALVAMRWLVFVAMDAGGELPRLIFLMPAAALLLPLCAFLVEALGRPSRRGPTGGDIVSLSSLLFLVVFLAMPEALNYQMQSRIADGGMSPTFSLYRLMTGEWLPVPAVVWVNYGLAWALLTFCTAGVTAAGAQLRGFSAVSRSATGVHGPLIACLVLIIWSSAIVLLATGLGLPANNALGPAILISVTGVMGFATAMIVARHRPETECS